MLPLEVLKTEGKVDFESALLSAVDDVLREVLGETAAEIIFSNLERNHGLRREEIPRRVGEFDSALTGLLGSGARTLEMLMIQRLCSKLRLEYGAKPEVGFAYYVQNLRKQFESLKEK